MYFSLDSLSKTRYAMKTIERGRPKLSANERFFFETLYYTLQELLRVAEHLNLPQVVQSCNELLDEVQRRFESYDGSSSSALRESGDER